MEKTVKILLIVCFILVAGLSVSLGFILGGNLLKDAQPAVSAINQSINTTNQVVNNSTASNSQNTTKAEKKVITQEQAHHLAQQYVNNDNGKGCSVTYGNPVNGVYHMIIYGIEGNYIGDVYVNAYTGNLIKIKWLHD